MTLTLSRFGLANLMMLLCGPAVSHPTPRPDLKTDVGDSCDSRAFLRDMISRNPEVIQSEYGLTMLMSLYPRQL